MISREAEDGIRELVHAFYNFHNLPTDPARKAFQEKIAYLDSLPVLPERGEDGEAVRAMDEAAVKELVLDFADFICVGEVEDEHLKDFLRHRALRAASRGEEKEETK
jgi:hypothetical protein